MILEFLTSYRTSYLYGTESFLLQLASEAREAGLAGTWQGQSKGIQAVGSSPQLVEGGTVHFHDEHLYIELRHLETGDLAESGPGMLIISTLMESMQMLGIMPGPIHATERDYPLRSLVTCVNCGAYFVGTTIPRRDGKRDHYYRCV